MQETQGNVLHEITSVEWLAGALPSKLKCCDPPQLGAYPGQKLGHDILLASVQRGEKFGDVTGICHSIAPPAGPKTSGSTLREYEILLFLRYAQTAGNVADQLVRSGLRIKKINSLQGATVPGRLRTRRWVALRSLG